MTDCKLVACIDAQCEFISPDGALGGVRDGIGIIVSATS